MSVELIEVHVYSSLIQLTFECAVHVRLVDSVQTVETAET